MKRLLMLVLYYGCFQWLPNGRRPFGRVSRRLRALAGRTLFASAGDNINIERRVYFGSGAQISLGERAGIGQHSRLYGPVAIGDRVMIGPEVLVFTQNHAVPDLPARMIDEPLRPADRVEVCADSWLGARTILLPGVRVGEGSVVGAGSVVARDIPDGVIAAGNPVRVIRARGQGADVTASPKDTT